SPLASFFFGVIVAVAAWADGAHRDRHGELGFGHPPGGRTMSASSLYGCRVGYFPNSAANAGSTRSPQAWTTSPASAPSPACFHHAAGKPWEVLLADKNVPRGGIWVLVPPAELPGTRRPASPSEWHGVCVRQEDARHDEIRQGAGAS